MSYGISLTILKEDLGFNINLEGYLNYIDYINLLVTDNSYYVNKDKFNYILEKKKEKDVTLHLKKYNFLKFKLGLEKLSKNYLDHLLFIVFNKIDIPAIWKNPTCGYYDIRYMFELIYLGARIKIDKIQNKFNRQIYNIYYDKLIKNLSDSRDKTIKDLLNKYEIFFILDKKYLPYPKDKYNIENW